MNTIQLSLDVRKIWKVYPVRISGKSDSACCRQPTFLVQSMDGGFVTRNCPKCGKPGTLPKDVFMNELDIWVACRLCAERMKPAELDYGTFGFICEKCDASIKLGDLLPSWEDLATELGRNR